MRQLAVPWNRLRCTRPSCYLSQVMSCVGTMELPPLPRAERSKKRMIQQCNAVPEAPLGICESGVHGHQRIVEAPH